MDQKNDPADGVTTPDATNTPNTATGPNEVSIDLSSLETNADGTPGAPVVNAADGQSPVGDPQAPAPDTPMVAFTTDSSGNVQAVNTPEPQDGSVVTPTDTTGPDVPPVDSFAQPPVDQMGNPNPADIAAPAVASEVTAPDVQQPVVAPAPDMNGMPQPPQPATDQTPGVAPVPTPQKDKKMLLILSVAAVILLAAIVAMMFI
jgi:hypothetical protein